VAPFNGDGGVTLQDSTNHQLSQHGGPGERGPVTFVLLISFRSRLSFVSLISSCLIRESSGRVLPHGKPTIHLLVCAAALAHIERFSLCESSPPRSPS
jgi:hypothetical protein